MPKLEWNNPGTRLYETGVDRGVLYINGEAHAWNGITSINESPSGTNVETFDYDGFRYAHIARHTNYEATINAYGAPLAFQSAIGVQPVGAGLFAGDQPRVGFELAYRSMIGSDVKLLDEGYKLHLVYNAIANSSDMSHRTLSDVTEPHEFSWTIVTKPRRLPGIRPTAHYIVDSRYCDPVALTELETILYGSDLASGIMPTPEAVRDILTV